MAAGVMVLDVQEVGRVLEGAVVPVQVSEPGVDARVPAAHVADVALEVLDVDGVEADQGYVPIYRGKKRRKLVWFGLV